MIYIVLFCSILIDKIQKNRYDRSCEQGRSFRITGANSETKALIQIVLA